jgi:hypothetical protein
MEELEEDEAKTKSLGYFVGIFAGLFVLSCAFGYLFLSLLTADRPRPAVSRSTTDLAPSPPPAPEPILAPGRLLVTVQVARADSPDRVWTRTYATEGVVEAKRELGRCFLLLADVGHKLAAPSPRAVPFQPEFISLVAVPCPPDPAVKKLRR